MVEIWKDIPGYEGRYQASTQGRIKSLTRKVRSINHYTNVDFFRTVPEHCLRPGRYCKSGHVSVVLEHGGQGRPVHQLVMKAFMGEPPKGMEILHRNGDPTDNRLCNLHYGTRTENILDTYQHNGRWRKLTIVDVKEIRNALQHGACGADLARQYGVSPATISSIRHKHTYWWLG